MHEWALADSIVSTAVKFAKKKNAKEIKKLDIKIGEIQQIDAETFRFIIRELFERHPELFKDTELNTETEKCVLKCRGCNNEWQFSAVKNKLSENSGEAIHFIPELAHDYMRCPKCKSPDFKILRGRGVWIGKIAWE